MDDLKLKIEMWFRVVCQGSQTDIEFARLEPRGQRALDFLAALESGGEAPQRLLMGGFYVAAVGWHRERGYALPETPSTESDSVV